MPSYLNSIESQVEFVTGFRLRGLDGDVEDKPQTWTNKKKTAIYNTKKRVRGKGKLEYHKPNK